MSVRDVFTMLKNSPPAPAYLLLGGDAFLQSFTIEKISEKFSSDNSCKKTVYSLDEDDAETILAEITGISLFSEQRITIIRQIKKFRKTQMNDVLSWIKTNDPSQCVFFILDEFDQRLSVVKDLQPFIPVVDVRTPFPNKVRDWVNFIAKTKGMTISSQMVELLIESCGDSIGKISNELEKLAIIDESNTNGSSESVISAGREFPVWQLIDAVGKKDLASACKIYFSLYLNNVPLTRIVFNLSNMFQQLLWTKMGDTSSSSIGVNKIIQRNLQTYSGKYSNDEVCAVISGLRLLDYKVKSTSINDKELMIPFLMRSCKGMYGTV